MLQNSISKTEFEKYCQCLISRSVRLLDQQFAPHTDLNCTLYVDNEDDPSNGGNISLLILALQLYQSSYGIINSRLYRSIFIRTFYSFINSGELLIFHDFFFMLIEPRFELIRLIFMNLHFRI